MSRLSGHGQSLKPYDWRAASWIRLCAEQGWRVLSWLSQKHSCHSSRAAKRDMAPLGMEVQRVAAEDIFVDQCG